MRWPPAIPGFDEQSSDALSRDDCARFPKHSALDEVDRLAGPLVEVEGSMRAVGVEARLWILAVNLSGPGESPFGSGRASHRCAD